MVRCAFMFTDFDPANLPLMTAANAAKLCNRGKTQGGRGWVATNSGRYGMAGLPGTASLEPR